MRQAETIITIRGTREERATIHQQAARHNMSLNGYVRWKLGLDAPKGSHKRRGNPRWKPGWKPGSDYRTLEHGDVVEVGDVLQVYDGGPFITVQERTRYRGLRICGHAWNITMGKIYRRHGRG